MPNTAQFILNRLTEWGIQRVFAYPGDGINGMLGAFGRVGDPAEFIQPRHEEIAAFMACAHAKFTGEVGCCMATLGTGRGAPAQRAVRREDGPPAGGRDRRPAEADLPGRHCTSRRST